MSKPLFRDEYLEAAIEDLIETQGSYDALRFGLGSEFSQAVTDQVDVLIEFGWHDSMTSDDVCV